MKADRGLDILVNVVAPVGAGCSIYFLKNFVSFPSFTTNYLADGLWAYAFISMVLIIWERQIKLVWILVVFIIAIGFETLQYYHTIAGTGDVCDIITYFIFFIIALVTNPLHKTKR